MTLHQSGDIVAAEPLYRKVTAAQSAPGQADFMLGALLMQAGRADEAVTCFRTVTCAHPQLAEAQAMLGDALLTTGDISAAENAFTAALTVRPGDPGLAYKLGLARFRSGDAAGALARFEASLKTGGKEGVVLREAGRALSALMRLEEAEAHLKKAAKKLPGDAATLYLQTVNYQLMGNPDAALVCVDALLKIDPENFAAIGKKAELLERKGNFAEAYDLLAPHLKETPDPQLVLAFGVVGRHVGKEEEAGALLDTAVGQTADPETRRLMHHRAGDLYDRMGKYDKAFAHYESGNALSALPFSPAAFTEMINGLIQAFDANTFSSLPRLTSGSDVPVFVVGMPRSGTSLVEQIIASHPQADGAGELDRMDRVVRGLSDPARALAASLPKLSPKKLAAGAKDYLSFLTSFAPDAKRITDKMPHNFLHLGFISLLFPNSRIVHLVRDPMDTCLSCYFQHFVGQHPYAANLSHLGYVHREYQRLMDHWKQVLNLPILDVVYEELVADQEGKSRELIHFIGLPWDDACLHFNKHKRVVSTASYDQVRKPIYKGSVARWRRYEKHLKPLQNALNE